MKKRGIKAKIPSIIIYIILISVSLTCVLPFINLFAVSLSSSSAVSSGKVVFWPIDFTTFSYKYALQSGKFLKATWISIKLVAIGTVINLILAILTAFPLSKTKEQFMGRNIYMAYFFTTCLIGGGLIPTYLVVVKAGLKDTLWSMILPGALPVFNMIILMNFIRGIPVELEEAAMIDGAGKLKILVKVMLPLLKPSLATIALFSIVGHWNDWFGGLIYMDSPSNYPLQTYMQSLLMSFEELMMKTKDYAQLLAHMNARTGRAAQLFLGAIPIIIIYPFLQKYFTTGMTIGSVKG